MLFSSFGFVFSLVLLLVGSVNFVTANDNIQRGCGIFLPATFSDPPPCTNTAAENRTFYNNFCSNWQCSRALEVTAFVEAGDATKYVCIRGAEEGQRCLVDSDCYGQDIICNQSISNDAKNITPTSTCQKSSNDKSKSPLLGFIALALTAILWGSNFIPARQAKAGNGILFQFVMCAGIATVGFLVQVFRSTGNLGFTFYPSACVGGMLWALANSFCIPIIQLTGLGLAVSLWSSSNMIMGWAFATFGVWGLSKPDLARPSLSYLGAVFGVICFAILSFVRPNRHDPAAVGTADENQSTTDSPLVNAEGRLQSQEKDPLINEKNNNSVSFNEVVVDDKESSDKANAEADEFPIIALVGGFRNARILGVVCALLCGAVFGLNNDPVVHLMDNYKTDSKSYIEKSSPEGLDYVFSHFSGAFFTSLLILLLLGIYEKVRVTYPESKIGKIPQLFGKVEPTMDLIWPAFLCGVGWAGAQTFSFVAETHLGMSVAYPIATLGPSLVSVLWSVFYFKELKGTTNILMLVVAFSSAGVSAGLIVASRN